MQIVFCETNATPLPSSLVSKNSIRNCAFSLTGVHNDPVTFYISISLLWYTSPAEAKIRDLIRTDVR